MKTKDPRGIEISTPSREAAEQLEAVVESFVSFRGEPLVLLDPLLEAWPEFALAHVVKALALAGLGERRFAAAASRSLAKATEHLDDAGKRERALYTIAESLIRGELQKASRRVDARLLEEPRDILSLHLGHSIDFNLGDAWNLRNRVARVLPHWQEGDPGYAQVLAMHAFGLEECNQYPEAERDGMRALALDAANPWAVHAVVHVMEMQGRIDDGVAHLTSRRNDWAENSPFAYHNWWHLALLLLDADDSTAALTLYDKHINTPEASFALAKLDATALLWRLKLLDVDVGERWTPLHTFWLDALSREGGYNAFHDLHAALCFAAVGDREALAELERCQRAELAAAPTAVLEQVALPLTRALADYERARFAETADALTLLRDQARRFGGSHAQRDLLTLTLMDAAARGGKRRLAAHFLNERLVEKPASPLGWRLKERYAA